LTVKDDAVQASARSLRLADGGSPHGTSWGRPLSFLRRLLLSDYFILYLTIAYFIVLAIFVPDLASPRNVTNQIANIWPLLAVAIGQTFVITIAGIDLSQGAIMGFVSVVGAAIMSTMINPALLGGSPLWGWMIGESGGLLAGNPYAVPAAIAAMLLVGMLIGLLNGFFIARFGMPAFMVTLVSLMFFSSAGIWLTQSQNINQPAARFHPARRR
jgi:ribose/xylose/arabinose/galactoside ABC-type transport system permease subunit